VAAAAARLLALGRVIDLSIEEPPVEDVIRAMFTVGHSQAAP